MVLPGGGQPRAVVQRPGQPQVGQWSGTGGGATAGRCSAVPGGAEERGCRLWAGCKFSLRHS